MQGSRRALTSFWGRREAEGPRSPSEDSGKQKAPKSFWGRRKQKAPTSFEDAGFFVVIIMNFPEWLVWPQISVGCCSSKFHLSAVWDGLVPLHPPWFPPRYPILCSNWLAKPKSPRCSQGREQQSHQLLLSRHLPKPPRNKLQIPHYQRDPKMGSWVPKTVIWVLMLLKSL